MRGKFQTYKKLNGQHAAGARAIRVYVCANCDMHHRPRPLGRPGCICMAPGCLGGEGKPPVQCHCGWLEFLMFMSDTEATHWSQLRTLERRKVISDLKRQVRFPLYVGLDNGERIAIAHYVADFTWIRDGVFYVGDSKPEAGVDHLAALKLKWMEAQGQPVTIITKGVYS